MADPPEVPRPEVDPRTLDEVFGDVLPQTTSDERGAGDDRAGTSDDWFLQNRPPHHDR